jgi:Na+-translocating ferredoxin:NAD+ oxidoreductase RnfE subunit
MIRSSFRQKRTTARDVIEWLFVVASVTTALGILLVAFTFALGGVLGYFQWPM